MITSTSASVAVVGSVDDGGARLLWRFGGWESTHGAYPGRARALAAMVGPAGAGARDARRFALAVLAAVSRGMVALAWLVLDVVPLRVEVLRPARPAGSTVGRARARLPRWRVVRETSSPRGPDAPVRWLSRERPSGETRSGPPDP